MRICVGCQMGLYLGHDCLHNTTKAQSADFSCGHDLDDFINLMNYFFVKHE